MWQNLRKMNFLLVILILVGTFMNTTAQLEDSQKFVCKAGVPYEENECNRCVCTLDNKLLCTRRACPWNYSKGRITCAVGIKWERKCNNACWCVENFGTLCTAYECENKN